MSECKRESNKYKCDSGVKNEQRSGTVKEKERCRMEHVLKGYNPFPHILFTKKNVISSMGPVFFIYVFLRDCIQPHCTLFYTACCMNKDKIKVVISHKGRKAMTT